MRLDLIEGENPALKDASLYAKQVALDTFKKCEFHEIPKFDPQDQSITCCDQVFKLRAFTSLDDREYFHEQTVRTEADVRDALQVPASIKFRDPSVMDVMCKTKYLNHYRFDNSGVGLPRICFSPIDLDVAPGSVELVQNPSLDILFAKWELHAVYQSPLKIRRRKRKLSGVDFDFKPRRPAKKSRKNVFVPYKLPIQGARTGPHSKFVWTGRMKFYKTWLYEVRCDDGTVTRVSLGSLRQPEYSNYRGIDNLGYAICKKYKSWVYADIIMGDVFVKTPKARNQMPEAPNERTNDELWQ